MSNRGRRQDAAIKAWRRWEMSSFDMPTEPAAQDPPAPALDLDLLHQEIARLRETARQRGHEEGYAAGHTQGLERGTEEGHRQGHEVGYEEGYAAGLAAAQQEVREQAQQLTQLLQASTDALLSMEAEVGQSLIALATRIAEQVLRTTIEVHPDKLLDVLRDILLLEIGKQSVLKLRLHPDDVALAERYLGDEAQDGQWRLLPDESIARGGCIAETALGNIDATLQTRWERVVSSLGQPGLAALLYPAKDAT